MTKDFYLQVIVLIVGGLVYSIVSFAYMHNTFASKDVLEMIDERLNRIERKVDQINSKKNYDY